MRGRVDRHGKNSRLVNVVTAVTRDPGRDSGLNKGLGVERTRAVQCPQCRQEPQH